MQFPTFGLRMRHGRMVWSVKPRVRCCVMVNAEATARPGLALSNGTGPYPESAYSFLRGIGVGVIVLPVVGAGQQC